MMHLRTLSQTALALVATASALLFSPAASAYCYIVYGPAKDIVYRAPEPPIDMSRQIHETLPLVAPGATLVFTPDNDGCELTINELPLASAQGRAVPGAVPRPGRADRG